MRGQRRSRSRSRSPDGRSRRREYGGSSSTRKSDDTWKKNTDAFLQNLGAAAPGLNPQVRLQKR